MPVITSTPVANAAPIGPAGGDLAGTFPNPTIGAGKVVAADIAAGAAAANLGAAGGDLSGSYPSPALVGFAAGSVAVGPSDATEVTIIDAVIPGGLVAATDSLRAVVSGDLLNNSGASRTFTLRIYLAGTKVFDDTTVNITATVNRRTLSTYLAFYNSGATNVNRIDGVMTISGSAAPVAGVGGLVSAQLAASFSSGPIAVVTSADWHFKVTMQLSASDANYSARMSALIRR